MCVVLGESGGELGVPDPDAVDEGLVQAVSVT